MTSTEVLKQNLLKLAASNGSVGTIYSGKGVTRFEVQEEAGEVYLYAYIGLKTASKLVYVYETNGAVCHLKGKLYRGKELELFILALGKLDDADYFA